MSAEVIEPVCIGNAWCDGLAAVRVDAAGVARVNLYADQLEPGGEMSRVLVARLTMSREVMREVADRMLTESMVAFHRSADAAEERRRRMD